jgi:general secretion pathway protein C
LGVDRFHDNRRMVSNLRNSWAVAATTFLLWGLVAASAVYWGMKFTARPGAPSGGPPAAAPAPAADPAAIAALLGAAPNAGAGAPVASLSSRFVLTGVVADQSHSGAALIAVDGKPPKPYRVGANVDENLVLQSVDSRRAVLGAAMGGAPALTLELPPPRR